ncbi:MAG: ribosomal protein S18-alanine N-acetyltransferase [Clostridia bacterium]|nr:ribosomal protein S18-alanine N-acetyltransferase [Clostridia bacterium]
MTKVLFVCTGNTCRSPMAQVCADNFFEKNGVPYTAQSCGIAVGIGDSITKNAKEVLEKRYGKEVIHRAIQINAALVEQSQIIVGITSAHTEMIKNLFPDNLKGKVVISMPKDISDPYGCGVDEYQKCLQMIESGIESIFSHLCDVEEYEDFEIHPYNVRYAHDMYRIAAECFSNPWSEQEFCRLDANEYARGFVALKDGKITGFVTIYCIDDWIEITDIAVSSEFRRMGIGQALLDRAVRFAKDKNASCVRLEVRASNSSAISLYKKKGFEKVGVRKNYYSSPVEDAELFDLKLC